MPSLKTKLAGNDRLTAHLCAIPSPVVTQAIAAAGADAVIVDMEHGAIDHTAAQAMIAAVAGSGCAPLVRVPAIDEVAVKRALDLGAEGICFPLVRTAEDVRRAIASLRYPPRGTRGFGPFIAQSQHRTDLLRYRDAVEPHLVAMILIETADAVANIDAILAVEGIDLVVAARFDLSTELGVQGQFDHPDLVAAVERIDRAADAAGIPRGEVALSRDQADAAFARGARLIAGVDVLWLRAAAAEAQGWCGAP